MKSNNNIFLIGLGGAGKTSVGKILAKILRYKFIDLDIEFCRRFGSPRAYIETYSYQVYGKKIQRSSKNY